MELSGRVRHDAVCCGATGQGLATADRGFSRVLLPLASQCWVRQCPAWFGQVRYGLRCSVQRLL